jgi:hypothetical protein
VIEKVRAEVWIPAFAGMTEEGGSQKRDLAGATRLPTSGAIDQETAHADPQKARLGIARARRDQRSGVP